MLPRAERLLRRQDFAATYGRKRSWAGPLLVLYVRRHPRDDAPSDSSPPSETRRFGFSVSKKVGKAVRRNAVKRRLRAICRERSAGWQRGFDAILVARSAAADAGYADLDAAVRDLFARAGLETAPPSEEPRVQPETAVG